MKFRSVAAMAALSLVAMPAAANPAGGEIELHIEASAQVPPDRAEVVVTASGSGKTEAEATADLARNEESLLASLAKKGVDRSKVHAGKDAITFDAEASAACAAADAAAQAGAAAAEAAGPSTGKRRKPQSIELTCSDEPLVYANKTLLVQLDDIALIEQVPSLQDGVSNLGRLRPVFSQSDPVAARSKARVQALAKARAEAEAYAEAMGYRVVRIVRVSNARPAMAMNDIIGFFAMIDSKPNKMQPSWFAATIMESVAIDYVIAPK